MSDNDIEQFAGELGEFAYDLGVQAGLESAAYMTRTILPQFPDCSAVLMGLIRALEEQAKEAGPKDTVLAKHEESA